MFPYIPTTEKEEIKMLKSIGLSSIEDLFLDIPKDLRLLKALKLGNSLSEIEITRHIKNIAEKNKDTDDLICFMGAGAYDHYIPSVIKHITSRSEFYTAYTPYQPEISQGTLQVIFEYQTLMANLTGMDVSNASMYDGATASAEAAMMAVENTKRKSIVVSKSVNPETRKALSTYMRFHGVEVIEVDTFNGATDLEQLKAVVNTSTAGVIIQNPNFFGIIEDMTEVEKITHSNKSLMIINVDPISLGILKSPGEWGADIAVGEGQSLGNHMNFGGPYLGFLATTSKLARKMPGRIVGQTEDIEGMRAYVLTLQTREQHIRREKASSNICSNQSLNALAAVAYLATIGKQGLREVAEHNIKKSHYALNQIIASSKYEIAFKKQPFFNEFVIKSTLPSTHINKELLKSGILGGYELQKEYPIYNNHLMLCTTEKRTKEEIDTLARVMGGIK
jgi:glycine dehydrogenase subunit 1